MTTLLENKEKFVGGKNEDSSESLAELEIIVDQCLKTKGSWGLVQNDVMFAVTFWSMLRAGFVSSHRSESDEAPDKNVPLLPKGWKHDAKHVYEAKFVLPPYMNHSVRLVALPVDDVLCINAMDANASPGNVRLRSLAVNSSRHVPRPNEKRISSKFYGLEEFDFRLRNSVAWPIRCSILTDEGITNGSLSGLSEEIKLKIMSYLEIKELLDLSRTCRDLHRISNDQGLWKRFYHRNFKRDCKCFSDGTAEECEESSDWKENYKRQHALKCNGKLLESSSDESFHTPQETPFAEFRFDIY